MMPHYGTGLEPGFHFLPPSENALAAAFEMYVDCAKKAFEGAGYQLVSETRERGRCVLIFREPSGCWPVLFTC
jgi:hypothetical protein